MNRHVLILSFVVAIGLFLRVYKLSTNPPGFTPDEAAFGYNAYSILQTGMDEWGTPWYRLPYKNLRSFGDYKMPLYVFLSLPSIKLFGLNEFATRLPNALIGTLAIVSVYLLSKKLTSDNTALITAALTAISPWSIGLSRGAFEANLVTFFLPLGIYLFLINSFIWSGVVFAINLYSYHSARLITPILLLFLAFAHIKKPFLGFTKFIIVLAVLSLPAVLSYFGAGVHRVSDVSILSPTDKWQYVSDMRFMSRNAGLPDAVSRFFSNKAVYVFRLFTQNYLTYFSPQFLFTTGPAEGTYGLLPGTGLLYLIELPFLLFFCISTIKKPNSSNILILTMLLVAPLPAALAKGPGYAANRAASMIPFLTIAAASGISLIKKKYLPVISLLYFISCVFFLQEYFYTSSYRIGQSMLFGRNQAFTRFIDIADRFSEVQISTGLSEPHIYLAFFQKIPPKDYQAASNTWLVFEAKNLKFLDQLDGYRLGKYRFGSIHPKEEVRVPTLFVGKSDEFPPNFPNYFHIDLPNGEPTITVAEKLPKLP